MKISGKIREMTVTQRQLANAFGVVPARINHLIGDGMGYEIGCVPLAVCFPQGIEAAAKNQRQRMGGCLSHRLAGQRRTGAVTHFPCRVPAGNHERLHTGGLSIVWS